LQTIGITYRVENGNVTIDRVGDAAFDPARTYKIAINDFLAKGGDGYAIFKNKPAEKGPKLVKDLVIDFIKTKGVITAEFVQSIR
ncbi:MAG: 5'-nucleotidase C-terminal domain-containing protein, partial [Desulfomonile sp.]|nr:5'-nucleotidase C-terminal domain-containing protein [Desulfomonile sp.]